MTRPIQIRTASQGDVAAFLQRQREEEGKAARVKSARNRDWQSGYGESDLESEAWEQAAAHLLDEGRELFDSEAAAQMQFDRIVKRRAMASSQQTYPEDASWTPTLAEKSRAFFLALRQAALAGIIWYVHSRMMKNIKEMRSAEDG